MEPSQIELLPGYDVLEFTPGHTILTIPSGYTVKAKRIGPYVFEPLLDDDRFRDPGPFKIKVKLLEKLQPPGVIQEIVYDPPDPEDVPSKEKNESAWSYYQAYLAHKAVREQVLINYARARRDMALLVGLEVLDGPTMIDDDGWIEPLLAILEEPETVGDEMLLFIKTQVIRSVLTGDILRELTVVKEVTLEGLKRAFDSFWRRVAGDYGVSVD